MEKSITVRRFAVHKYSRKGCHRTTRMMFSTTSTPNRTRKYRRAHPGETTTDDAEASERTCGWLTPRARLEAKIDDLVNRFKDELQRPDSNSHHTLDRLRPMLAHWGTTYGAVTKAEWIAARDHSDCILHMRTNMRAAPAEPERADARNTAVMGDTWDFEYVPGLDALLHASQLHNFIDEQQQDGW